MTKKTTALVALTTLFVGATLHAQTSPGPQPSICNRACWTARAGTCTTTISTLSRAIIHHTAGSGDYNVTTLADGAAKVRGVQNYHMDVNAWCDVGYHFLVDKNGNIFEARAGSLGSSPWKRGAHDGCNTDSMGFTLLGYFHSPYNHDPNATMRGALYDVIAWRMPSGWSPYGSGTYCSVTVGTLDGHRKVKATACPGDTMHPPYITENYNGGDARTGVANRRGAGGSTEVIVDNGTANFTASANWTTSVNVAGYYGSNYQVRSTASVSDVAQWNGSLATSGTYTVHAWWTAATDRSTTAPYIVERDGGSTTVSVNQQINGGKWNSLGSFSITSGTRYVKLSCWTTTGFYVIADAVKWVK